MTRLLEIMRARPAVAWLFTLTLATLGIVCARSMPSAIYPEVEFPRIVVVARHGGAPADVFVTSVTRPLEASLATVLGVQTVRSKTIRGATDISLQFAPGTDMWRALGLVESRVNEARASLPPGTELIVEQVTTGSFPIVTFNLAGHVDPRELRELGELVVRPAMASVQGVGRIEVLGGDVREVEIVLDPERTAALHLTPEGIAAKLQTAMGLTAVGRVERDRQLVTVVADAVPKTISDIGSMPVGLSPSGVPIALQDIAEVIEGAEDRIVRVGGPRGATVILSVARMPGASTTDVVAGVTAVAQTLAPSLPPGVTLTPVYDQAELVSDSMASVRDAIVIGILLCAIVIGLFLRDARAGLLAGVAVPITLAITFVFMRATNQTLNLMSLGGMAVSIGLVVDDVIVIVEAIARKRSLGMTPHEASIAGTAELAPAVIGTTLTTVVVFIPLGFLSGVVGDFFRALAFTLTAAVVVSLAVAILIVPLASTRLMRSHARESSDVGRIAKAYARVASWLSPRPRLAIALLVGFIIVGGVAAPGLERGFLPELDEGAFVLDYFLPEGTSLETTEHFARQMEKTLRDTKEVRTFSRRLGAELGPATATQLNRGDIMIRLVPRSQRKRNTRTIIDDLRQKVTDEQPEVRLEFIQVLQDVLNDLAGSPHPVEVKIFGPDPEKLHEIGDAIATKLEPVRGLVDLFNGQEHDAPELDLLLRRDAIALYGLTPDEVSLRLEHALLGVHVGSIRRFDRLVNVRLRYPNPVRFDPERVLGMPVSVLDQTTTLDSVAAVELRASPSVLLHEALQPVVIVSGDHKDRDVGSLSDEVEKIARTVQVPSGYRVVLGGQAEGERTAARDVAGVAAVAMLLVLAVLAGQFKRLRLAALTLLSVPVAMVGAVLALRVTSTPLNASSLMGAVLLVGLVVKNGVLLLEAAERARDDGASAEEAVRTAAERRLRPVIMTTLATLAGLFPLALGIGAGSELQRPLAIAVMGGLVTSTVATLGLMPPLAARALK